MEEVLPSSEAAARQVERHFRRNLTAALLWELVWGFGQACASTSILIAFLGQLTESKTLIGAVNLAYLAALPMLLIGSYFNLLLPRKRLAIGLLHVAETSAWVVTGLLVLHGGSNVSYLLYVIFAAQFYYYLVNGVLLPATLDLLGGVFQHRFGTAAGFQWMVNRTAGTAGGIIAAALLSTFAFPANFGVTFLVGGVCLVVSNAAVMLMVEPPYGLPPMQPRLLEFIRSIPAPLIRDRKLHLVLAVRAVAAFIIMAQSFYVLYALERLDLDLAFAGIFTAVLFASNGLGGLALGWLSDRMNYRTVLLAAMGLNLPSLAGVILMNSIWEFYVFLAIGGAAGIGVQVATMRTALNLAPPGQRGNYAASTQFVFMLVTGVSLLVSGLVIDLAGYTTLFVATGALCLVGMYAAFRISGENLLK